MKKATVLLFGALGAVLAFIALAFGRAPASAPPDGGPAGPVALSIHPETTLQTMEGFGAGFNSDAYISKIARPEDRERAYDLLFGPQENGVRLNIVRLVVSDKAAKVLPASPPAAPGLLYDWGGDPSTQAVWRAIKPALARTKALLYAVPFTPPAAWKDNGAANKGGRLLREHYADYADYLADFAHYYHKILATDIDVLSLQNEPGIAAVWTSCLWTGEELRDFLKILAPRIRARGLKTKLMLSEGTAWSGAWTHLQPALFDPQARPFLDILASHSYGPVQDAGRTRFAEASLKYGLPVWMSEMSLMQPPEPDDGTMKAALRVADYIHRDITVGRASAWIYCFALFTYQFKGSMGVLSPADQPGREGRLVIPKRFWALAQFSQFAGHGWKALAVEGVLAGRRLADPETTAFLSPDGEGFVLIVRNPAEAARDVICGFGGRGIGPHVESFCTSEDHDLAPSVVPVAPAKRGFRASLPPRSLTTFRGRFAPTAKTD